MIEENFCEIFHPMHHLMIMKNYLLDMVCWKKISQQKNHQKECLTIYSIRKNHHINSWPAVCNKFRWGESNFISASTCDTTDHASGCEHYYTWFWSRSKLNFRYVYTQYNHAQKDLHSLCSNLCTQNLDKCHLYKIQENPDMYMLDLKPPPP